jgi:prepilin-type N-terminal cleavage/methylation domain-containing protein
VKHAGRQRTIDGQRGSGRTGRGFTLIELLLVIAIVALLVGLALPVLAGARKTGRQGVNVNNLKQLGTAAAGYSSDYRDAIATFSWQPGSTQRVYAGGGQYVSRTFSDRGPGAAVTPAAMQALTIIRLRGNPDFDTLEDSFADSWIPHPTFGHLVLLDYMAARVPAPVIVSPEDKRRQEIHEESRGWIDGAGSATTATTGRWVKRLPFSSSYTTSIAAFSPDRGRQGQNDLVTQGTSHIEFMSPSWADASVAKRYALGQRKQAEVEYPSQKVFMFEEVGRSGSEPHYFTHPEARVTNIMFDVSVRVERTSDVNRGGIAAIPTRGGAIGSIQEARIPYVNAPDGVSMTEFGYPLWPTDGSAPPTNQHGRQRWTLMGLKGIDIGGKDVIPPNARDDRRD